MEETRVHRHRNTSLNSHLPAPGPCQPAPATRLQFMPRLECIPANTSNTVDPKLQIINGHTTYEETREILETVPQPLPRACTLHLTFSGLELHRNTAEVRR